MFTFIKGLACGYLNQPQLDIQLKASFLFFLFCFIFCSVVKKNDTFSHKFDILYSITALHYTTCKTDLMEFLVLLFWHSFP